MEHEKEVLESKKQTLHPHSTCNITIPKEHISRMHSENAVLLHNCLYLRLTFQNPTDIVKKYNLIVFPRLYIGRYGVREEIGDGYNVGPGHGLIVSKIGDTIRVRPFFNSFQK